MQSEGTKALVGDEVRKTVGFPSGYVVTYCSRDAQYNMIFVFLGLQYNNQHEMNYMVY